jgi:hypothetical protein
LTSTFELLTSCRRQKCNDGDENQPPAWPPPRSPQLVIAQVTGQAHGSEPDACPGLRASGSRRDSGPRELILTVRSKILTFLRKN